jgi:hypothetical protein
MKTGRFSSIMTVAFVLNCLFVSVTFAGFGFGGDDFGESGLDFSKGYDVNTVRTITGRVVSPVRTGEQEQNSIEIRSGAKSVTLSLGPKSFLEKMAFPLHVDDEITVKGSMAQGRDGKIYMMVQKLTNRTTGAKVSLRDDQGEPGWSGNNANGMMWNSPRGGMMPGGGMMHGSGMMRGGGGMMRR